MASVVCPSSSDPGSDRSFGCGCDGGALSGALGSRPGSVGGSGMRVSRALGSFFRCGGGLEKSGMGMLE